ncbi:MAG: hypothetical protein NVS4B2_21920 [Chloroflexota bacterium]
MTLGRLAARRRPDDHRRRLRDAVLAVVVLDLALIGGRVLLYPSLLSQRGALVYVLEPVALLLVYAAIAVWITRPSMGGGRVALRPATIMGLGTGVLWIVNLSLETFAGISGAGIAATAPFLLGGFALWGCAGFLTARGSGSAGFGVVGAMWSAMICILATITFGFVLTYTSVTTLEHLLAGDPDFLRSHWSDLRAFAIANSFDSAFSHLLGGLVVSTVVGGVGGLSALAADRTGGSVDDSPLASR